MEAAHFYQGAWMLIAQLPTVVHWATMLGLFCVLGGASTGITFLLIAATRRH
jgi:hypothetical protein